jgi:hypothetical protein
VRVKGQFQGAGGGAAAYEHVRQATGHSATHSDAAGVMCGLLCGRCLRE